LSKGRLLSTFTCQYLYNEVIQCRYGNHVGRCKSHGDGCRLGLRIIAYLSWISLVLCLVVLHILILFANPASVADTHAMITCLQVNSSAEVVSSVDGVVTELLLDTEDLVELGKTLRSGRSTGLDLSSAETNDDVSNGDIFSLTRAVRDHDTPSGTKGVLSSLDSLSDGTNLVDLEQKCVAGLELDGLLDELGVGDSQVITDNLEVGSLVEVRPCLPIILSEGVLNADNGVLLGQRLVELSELLVCEPLALVAVGVLEVHVVLLLLGLVEFAGSDIHGNLDLASVASLLDGVGDEVKGLLWSLNIGSNTTLVTDVSGRLSVPLLGEALELLVDLGTLAHGLGESGGFSAIC
jgi:hypothetical protein